MGQSLNREPIVAALAARLKALCPDLKDVTRRYRAPHQVDSSEKPLAIVATGAQHATIRRGAPGIWNLEVPVYLYVHADEADGATPPSTQIHALVKEIEDALERQGNEGPLAMDEMYGTNLGLSNVFSCRLTAVETDEGLLDPEGLAALTIEIDAVSNG